MSKAFKTDMGLGYVEQQLIQTTTQTPTKLYGNLNVSITANADIITNDLTTTKYKIYVAFAADASGVLSAVIKDGTNTKVEALNNSAPLVANSLYAFEAIVYPSWLINFRYDVNANGLLAVLEGL